MGSDFAIPQSQEAVQSGRGLHLDASTCDLSDVSCRLPLHLQSLIILSLAGCACLAKPLEREKFKVNRIDESDIY